MLARRFLYLVFVLVSVAAAANAQSPTPGQQPGQRQETPSPLILKSNTRLVVVDVIATDSKGQAVTDLKREDFIILEDTREQSVSDFAFRNATKFMPVVQALPPNTFTNIPQYKNASSLNVVLLDTLNGEFMSRAYAQDRLVKFLEGQPTIQPTAIFAIEKKLALLHDFTTDTGVLKETLADFKEGHEAPRLQNPYTAASPYATHGDFHTDEKNVEITLRALKSLAQILAGYPGRKNVIWLSEAFPQTFFEDGLAKPGLSSFAAMHKPATVGVPPNDADVVQSQQQALEQIQGSVEGYSPETLMPGTGSNYRNEIAKVVDALMDAHVALYPVDAAGLGRANRIAAQSTMNLMAAGTGGKAFYNRNDLDSGVRGSIDDGSSYYTISYYPSNKTWNGKFRSIAVRTTRPGVNLRYRLGYYALNPTASTEEAHKKLVEDFGRALELDSPDATAVLFQASLDPTPDKSAGATKVTFAIDPYTLTFTHAQDGLEHAELSCAVAAYSTRGTLVKEEVTSLKAGLTADEYSRLNRGKLGCHRSIALKPGKYVLKLGVVDGTSGLIGTTVAKVTIP